MNTTNRTVFTLAVASCALLVTACSGFTPAVQGPRYYVAAHDTVTGKCEKEQLVPGRLSNKVEKVPYKHENVVKCVTTAVTTTGESN